MAEWQLWKKTNTHVEMVNRQTGVIKLMPLASDKQWAYLESLRREMTNRQPLKDRPLAFKAKEQIDKLLAKKKQIESQTKLL